MRVQDFLQVILLFTGMVILLSLWFGINTIRTGRRIPYFRTRQQRIGTGWRMIGFALLLSVLVGAAYRYREPLVIGFSVPIQTLSATPLPLETRPGISLTLPLSLTPIPTQSHTPTGRSSQDRPGTLTPLPDITPAAGNTLKPGLTASLTNTRAPTRTFTPVTPTVRNIATSTPKPTIGPSSTRRPTLSPTLTNTHAPTRTFTPVRTPTPVYTPVNTPTFTPQNTHAPTPTKTLTPTRQPTWTPTIKPTFTPQNTHAPTLTFTPTQRPTATRTRIVTRSP